MLLAALQAAAGASGGNTTRDYVLFESVDATTKNFRFGTVDVSDGTSTETSSFNAYSATFANYSNNGTDVVRLNGYIGYQTIYGFYIYKEDGTVVGSKGNSSYLLRSTIVVPMCVCGDFIVGFQPTNTNNFTIWKFDTTTEVFTSLSAEYSPNNWVFGATYLKPNVIGYTFINSSNYNVYKQVDLSTNVVTTLYTGAVSWNFSYPSAALLCRFDDDYYLRNIYISVTVNRLQLVDYATSTATDITDITANEGTTNKMNSSTKYVEGEHSNYIMLGFTYTGGNYGIALNKDLSTTPYVAFQGYLGRDTRVTSTPVVGSGGVKHYAYDSILVSGQGKIYSPITIREIDALTTTSGIVASFTYIAPLTV